MDICTPALVYLVIAVLTIIYMFYQRASLESMILKIVFGGLWVLLLNFLCTKGLETVSWILVILPYVLTGFLMTLILSILKTGLATGIATGMDPINPMITTLPASYQRSRQHRR